MTRRELLLSTAATAVAQPDQANPSKRWRLWYQEPATRWIEALPVGSGRVGAMIFGGTPNEVIQLNDQTLWSGHSRPQDGKLFRETLPKVRELLFAGKYDEANTLARKTLIGEWGKWYGAYQSLGELHLELPASTGGYTREVDLETGIARVEYQVGDVRWVREVFAKAGDDAIFVHVEASAPFSLQARMFRGGEATVRPAGNGSLRLEGDSGQGGVRFAAECRAVASGGTVRAEGDRLIVANAKAVTFVITPATTFLGGDLARASRAVKGSYKTLREDHRKQHAALFGRVNLDLGGWDKAAQPTGQRLAAVKAGSEDLQLAALYFQYGRYLLLSCSRPGGLPANLQGLWNHRLDPPWESDYHININIPMNYWPAEVANLSECHQPLFDFADRLREAGRRTAREFYGARGSVAHFTTNVWGFSEPGSALIYGLWQDALPWLCQHYWEHYRFTGDRSFLLNRAWPAMKEVAEFQLEFLVENPATGKLVPGPSASPENTYTTASGQRGWIAMGCATAVQSTRELFENCLAVQKILNTDRVFAKRVEEALARLAPSVQVGKYGQIMEWPDDLEEAEPGHRHVSHLYALHPGLRFNLEWSAAARKTLDRRLANGSGQTGWSAAWMINIFARLADGEQAHAILYKLLRQSTEPNLFDTHPYSGGPIFQIDGNLGGCAGIAEMLLQSHTGEIRLLPALPKAWSTGSVRGLRARGGFEIGMEWADGQIRSGSVQARLAGTLMLRAPGPVQAKGARNLAANLLQKEMKEGEQLRIVSA